MPPFRINITSQNNKKQLQQQQKDKKPIGFTSSIERH